MFSSLTNWKDGIAIAWIIFKTYLYSIFFPELFNYSLCLFFYYDSAIFLKAFQIFYFQIIYGKFSLYIQHEFNYITPICIFLCSCYLYLFKTFRCSFKNYLNVSFLMAPKFLVKTRDINFAPRLGIYYFMVLLCGLFFFFFTFVSLIH